MDPNQMFEVIISGVAAGLTTLWDALWLYAITNVWPFFVVPAIVLLKLIEVRVRSRPRRRRSY
ncbi:MULTISPECIES: hypothetical protein [unclassified Curtobacterium]|uniref:hypothetical protein n=1 Tax=unclassified Curtobacterium TaxID=257496 RepID=UPI0037FC56C8